MGLLGKRNYLAAAQQMLAEPETERAPHPADTTPPLYMAGQGERVLPPLRPDHVFDPMGGTIPLDEPVFVLRGSDQSAAIALQTWMEASRESCPHLMDAARDMLRRMQNWPDRRAAGWKVAKQEEDVA